MSTTMTILDEEYGWDQDFEGIIYNLISKELQTIILDMVDSILAELKSPQLKTDADPFSICGTVNTKRKNINFILKSRFIDKQHSNRYTLIFNNKNDIIIKFDMTRFENLIHITVSVAKFEHDISYYDK